MKSNIKKDEWVTLSSTQSNESFYNLLPIVKRISAQKIGLDLVDVQPMDGLTKAEHERLKREVSTINRYRKLDSILENKEYEEFKEKDHELFSKRKGPSMELFYLDFTYVTPTYSIPK